MTGKANLFDMSNDYRGQLRRYIDWFFYYFASYPNDELFIRKRDKLIESND